MSRRRLILMVDVLLLLVILSLALAACGPPKNPEVYQEGRTARQVFNRLVADARDFISGFCGTAPLGLAVTSVAVWVLRRRGA